jgi:hypothetical protein
MIGRKALLIIGKCLFEKYMSQNQQTTTEQQKEIEKKHWFGV